MLPVGCYDNFARGTLRHLLFLSRYLLRVTVSRSYGASIVKDFPIWVRNYEAAPEVALGTPIKARHNTSFPRELPFEFGHKFSA